MKTNNTPDGYTCGHCGRFAKFSAWLFAHWYEPVVHTCECGARSQILEGAATLKHQPPTTKGTKS